MLAGGDLQHNGAMRVRRDPSVRSATVSSLKDSAPWTGWLVAAIA
jgi:hypothetical protein